MVIGGLKMLKKFKLAPGQWQYFLEEKVILRQRIYVFVSIFLIFILMIFAFVERQSDPLSIRPTKLDSPINVGSGTASYQVQMLSAEYNPNSHVAQFKFSANTASSNSVFTGSELKFSGKTTQGDGEIKVIPTINNQWIVTITDLDKTFGAIQIQVSSNTPTLSTSTASIDSSSSSSYTSNVSNQKATFSVVQKSLKRNKDLKNQSAKQVTLDAVASEMKSNNQQISDYKKKIDDANKLINYDNDQINKLQQNTDSITQDEANRRNQTIQNLRLDITSTQNSLNSLNGKLSDAQQNDAVLKQKKNDVESGKFQFPEIQKASKIK